MKYVYKIIVAALTACLIFSQAVGYAQVQEYELKAAFLYNVALFTDWPADTFEDKDLPFNFCIAGTDPFSNSLDSLLTKLLKQRKISVSRLGKAPNFNNCQILFIPATENNRAEAILKEIKNTSTLTVSEDNSTFKKGSMLNLSIIENRLRFQVNMDAVSTAKLSISSKLLRLADSVQ
ncbi:MAG: YfiR family protein [Burkholderiales bacterium]